MSTRLEHIKLKRTLNRKYYNTIKYPEIPQYYKDVDLWWVITTANPDIIRRDSFTLGEGLEIRIPSNIQQIILDFEQLNK